MLVTPKEAVQILGMHRSTISECVAAGAPVHRWGPTGYRYKIDPDEFMGWMHSHGEAIRHREKKPAVRPTVDQLQEQRRQIMAQLLAG